MRLCGSANAPPEPAGLPDLVPTDDDEVFISSELNSSIFACTQIQYSLPLQKKREAISSSLKGISCHLFQFQAYDFLI